jgi:hypothetical protein
MGNGLMAITFFFADDQEILLRLDTGLRNAAIRGCKT